MLSFLSSLSQRIKTEPTKLCTTFSKHGALYPRTVGMPACQAARQELFDAAFEPWSEYETNFQDVWVYRSNDSGVTIGFLRGFLDYFSRFEDALDVIDSIIDVPLSCSA